MSPWLSVRAWLETGMFVIHCTLPPFRFAKVPITVLRPLKWVVNETTRANPKASWATTSNPQMINPIGVTE